MSPSTRMATTVRSVPNRSRPVVVVSNVLASRALLAVTVIERLTSGFLSWTDSPILPHPAAVAFRATARVERGQTMSTDWDATSYDALPLPHVAWGDGVLRRLRLRGDERVLDPGVSAVGVDASASMLELARERLAPFGDRVELVQADLTALPALEPVDAVMSVAAFHWIADHDVLFASLAAVMRPGARLTTDCGGAGNIAGVEAALSAVLGRPSPLRHYADAEVTAARLTAAGFVVDSVRLRPDPLVLDDPRLRSEYLRTVCLRCELADIPVDEQDDLVDAVRDAMASPVIDYVRLEIDAGRR